MDFRNSNALIRQQFYKLQSYWVIPVFNNFPGTHSDLFLVKNKLEYSQVLKIVISKFYQRRLKGHRTSYNINIWHLNYISA